MKEKYTPITAAEHIHVAIADRHYEGEFESKEAAIKEIVSGIRKLNEALACGSNELLVESTGKLGGMIGCLLTQYGDYGSHIDVLFPKIRKRESS